MAKTGKQAIVKKESLTSVHASILSKIRSTGTSDATLGHAAAIVIACACANTSPLNLPRTLQELGLDGISYQGCVFNAVRHAGCDINIDEIPNSPETTLIEVVNVIQNAPRRED